MMRWLCVAVPLAAAVPVPAAAADWYYIADSDTEQTYADADSVAVRDGITSVDTFAGLYQADEEDESIWYVVDRYEFRCPKNEFQVTGSKFYDVNRDIDRVEDYDPNWEPVADGTVAAFVYAFACKRERDEGQRLDNPFDEIDFARSTAAEAADAAAEAAEAAASAI